MTCPTCGAQAEEGQLVCLQCGSRVALGYRRPPSWRVPVAIVVAVLLLAVAATAVALNKIGDDADREVGHAPITVKRSKGAGAEKGKSTAQEKKGSTTPAGQKPSPGAELVQRGSLYEWPRDLKAFTVVLVSTEDRVTADNFARAASEGAPAKIGVIRGDDFKSLPKGSYVVFAGQYKDRPAAAEAAARLGKRFAGSSPRLVEP